MNTTTWIAGGAIVTAVVAAWGYIKTLWSYAASLVVLQVRVQSNLAHTLSRYLEEKGQRLRFGMRIYDMGSWPMRDSGRFEQQLHEVCFHRTFFYLYRGRPLSVRYSGKEGEGTTILALRGTLDAERLLREVVAYRNGITHTSDSGRRFCVTPILGEERFFNRRGDEHTGGSARVQAKTSDSPSGVSVDPQTQIADFLRFITCRREDIGVGERSGPSLQMLALDENAERFVSLVRSWLADRRWYQSRNIPWKIGARFVGAPGCGKSAMVRALAAELDLPVYVLDLATLSNREFRKAWSLVQENSPAIALFEDIDTVFSGRVPVREDILLTFDTLLNCLSGVQECDGVISIVTTNNPASLDPALIRPGRAEFELVMSPPDEAGRRKIIDRILDQYPEIAGNLLLELEGQTGAAIQLRCTELARELKLKELSSALLVGSRATSPSRRILASSSNGDGA